MRFYIAFLLPLIAFGQACKPDQLSVSGELRGAGLGHNYGLVIIQNVSKSACQLEGVPRGAILDDSGKVIPSKTQGNVGVNACGEGSNAISSKPGASVAVWTDTVSANYEENVCGTQMRMSLNGKSALIRTIACGEKGTAVEVYLSGFVDPNACGSK
jgi:hypothetical protein